MEIPVIVNNRAYTQGKNINQYWDYAATSISNQYYAQLEFKKSTDSAWSIEKERDYSKTHKYENLEGNTRYDIRIKVMYDYLYSYEDGEDGDVIDVQAESYADVTPATPATASSAYYTISNILTYYNNYIVGYNNEKMELPGIYDEQINDDIPNTIKTVGGVKIRQMQAGSSNTIEMKTRPIDYSKVMKLYGFLKSRGWQKETVYIGSLRKEIQAFITIKDISKNLNGNKNIYSHSISVEEA
jgi:uncharacterized protein (UPF0333 family)